MWKKPLLFQEYLSRRGLTNPIYDALEDKDFSSVVFAALVALKKCGSLPDCENEEKNESTSDSLRIEGNEQLAKRKYETALELYNKALLFAPPGSKAMKLAYYNRSVLLFQCKAYKAAMKDVSIIYSIGGIPEKDQQLKKRKKDAEGLMFTSLNEIVNIIPAYRGFLHVSHHHRQISCASSVVNAAIHDNQVPKLTAAEDIKVGTVVALETPFASQTVPHCVYRTCYYCHTYSFNLIPCDQCCYALFCNKNCMKQCKREYHDVECALIKVVKESSLDNWNINVKAVLKMKNQCTWEEFIDASKYLGSKRIMKSSVKEIFDVNHKFSLLCFPDDKHFVYGQIYNNSFSCAVLIDRLDTISSFWPDKLPERTEAKKAFCRILMFLTTYARPTFNMTSSMAWLRQAFFLNGPSSIALYPFAGKIKHECYANLIGAVVNNKLAMVAVKPIKKGTELTVSLWGHWLEGFYAPTRPGYHNYLGHQFICDCPICSGTTTQEYTLTETHKKCLQDMPSYDTINPSDKCKLYIHACKALALFSDVPFSSEYKEVFKCFRKVLLDLQQFDSANQRLK